MFLKQTSYKPRSNSVSSNNSESTSPTMSDNNNNNANVQASGKASSHNALPSANRGGTGANPTPANNVGGGAGWGDGGLFSGGGRRRSSANEGKFSGLNQLKRNSQDSGADAKKASFMEQKPGSGGVLSNMWNNFTKGPTGGG